MLLTNNVYLGSKISIGAFTCYQLTPQTLLAVFNNEFRFRLFDIGSRSRSRQVINTD